MGGVWAWLGGVEEAPLEQEALGEDTHTYENKETQRRRRHHIKLALGRGERPRKAHPRPTMPSPTQGTLKKCVGRGDWTRGVGKVIGHQGP